MSNERLDWVPASHPRMKIVHESSTGYRFAKTDAALNQSHFRKNNKTATKSHMALGPVAQSHGASTLDSRIISTKTLSNPREDHRDSYDPFPQ